MIPPCFWPRPLQADLQEAPDSPGHSLAGPQQDPGRAGGHGERRADPHVQVLLPHAAAEVYNTARHDYDHGCPKPVFLCLGNLPMWKCYTNRPGE